MEKTGKKTKSGERKFKNKQTSETRLKKGKGENKNQVEYKRGRRKRR